MRSAFMIDLAQVAVALRNSTERSLVLLDEFGKGTLPSGELSVTWNICFQWNWLLDGAGIFASCIEYLSSRGDNCPFVIATTHFHGNEILHNKQF